MVAYPEILKELVSNPVMVEGFILMLLLSVGWIFFKSFFEFCSWILDSVTELFLWFKGKK